MNIDHRNELGRRATRTTTRLVLAAAVLGGAGTVACGNSDTGTAVRLQVRFEPAWGLTDLQLTAGPAERTVPVAEELLLQLPDDRRAPSSRS